MNKKSLIVLIVIITSNFTFAQNDSIKKVYKQYVWEIFFQYNSNKANGNAINGIRVTNLSNFNMYTHIDFTSKFGGILGLGLKNIGFKTKEESVNTITYRKVIRRGLYFGPSVAFKYGDFAKHSFVYAGLGIDYGLHYRQKLYTGVFNSAKQGEWFSNAFNKHMPHYFIGFQIPYGLNIRYIGYFRDMYNTSYNGVFGDFRNNLKTKLHIISLSYQINESTKTTKKLNEKIKEPINL